MCISVLLCLVIYLFTLLKLYVTHKLTFILFLTLAIQNCFVKSKTFNELKILKLRVTDILLPHYSLPIILILVQLINRGTTLAYC